MWHWLLGIWGDLRCLQQWRPLQDNLSCAQNWGLKRTGCMWNWWSGRDDHVYISVREADWGPKVSWEVSYPENTSQAWQVSLRQVEGCWGRMRWLAGIHHNPNPGDMSKEEGEMGRVTARSISVTLQQSGTKGTPGERASHMKERRKSA